MSNKQKVLVGVEVTNSNDYDVDVELFKIPFKQVNGVEIKTIFSMINYQEFLHTIKNEPIKNIETIVVNYNCVNDNLTLFIEEDNVINQKIKADRNVEQTYLFSLKEVDFILNENSNFKINVFKNSSIEFNICVIEN